VDFETGVVEADEARYVIEVDDVRAMHAQEGLDCTEAEFIARFRIEGRALGGSPMPWESFGRMTDADLGAIYRYLRTLPHVETQVAQRRRSFSR